MFVRAGNHARAAGGEYFGIDHLGYSLLADSDSVAAESLRQLGLDLEQLRNAMGEFPHLAQRPAELSPVFTDSTKASPRVERVIERFTSLATAESRSADSGDLLVALFEEPSILSGIVSGFGCGTDSATEATQRVRESGGRES